jgi:hypothetical protein
MRKPVEIPKIAKPPDAGTTSVFCFHMGEKRYEIRTTVQARQIPSEPAEVIEMANQNAKEDHQEKSATRRRQQKLAP